MKNIFYIFGIAMPILMMAIWYAVYKPIPKPMQVTVALEKGCQEYKKLQLDIAVLQQYYEDEFAKNGSIADSIKMEVLKQVQ